MRQKKQKYDVLLETYKRIVADDNRMLTEQNKEIVRLQEELKHAKRLLGLYEACLNKGVKIDFPDVTGGKKGGIEPDPGENFDFDDF